MATICKNCAAPIVFDPKTQKVVCHTCGSSWDPKTIEVNEESPEMSEPDQETRNGYTMNYMACKVYACQSCGGEIRIHGSEASTKCIYCGNTSVVFSHISKEKAPDFVLPFKLTKEEAVASIKKSFKGHSFIPKEIRKIDPEMIRGIYVPYKIVNGRHFESAVVRSEISSGDTKEIIYSGRSGTMQIRNLPIDASYMLSNESSQQLEPFDLLELQEFHESYLLGFYSNAADSSDETIQKIATVRAINAFSSQVIKTVKGSEARVARCEADTYLYRDAVSYAMVPVWFATYHYKGQHNTVMVNAQTGKVVCGLPWDESLIYRVTLLLTVLCTIGFGVVIRYLLYAISTQPKNFENIASFLFCLFIPAISGFFLAREAEKRFDKIRQKLKLTQASSIFNFAKKRQE